MKHFIFLFLMIFLISCSSSRKLSYKQQMEGAPAWVKQSPNASAYYHGVGMASKVMSPTDYRELARQNALSELASAISVNISSSSVLNQFEFDDNFSEYFRDNIKLSTEQFLEGYELVESWENEQQYWVYYQLSKSKFEAIKQARIDKAVNVSKADFEKARDFEKVANFQESMRFYIKALEGIKDFLADDITTEVDGTKQSYTSLLIAEMLKMPGNLEIVMQGEKPRYTRGLGHENENLVLKVLYKGQEAVKGVNVNAEFSYAPGKSVQQSSDANGLIRVRLENIDTRKKEEYVKARANIDKLIRESTNDPVIRRLVESITFPEYVFPVEIVSPKWYVETVEKNLGTSLSSKIMERTFRTLLASDGFELVKSKDAADYILLCESDTQNGNEVNGKYIARLDAQIRLMNQQSQVVYTKPVSDISGLGSSFQAAGEDAFQSLESKIRISIYPAMYKSLFK